MSSLTAEPEHSTADPLPDHHSAQARSFYQREEEDMHLPASCQWTPAG